MECVKLSVLIISYNEEKNIARCLDSVKDIADEILVVDSFSSDKTKSICLSQKVRFVEHKFEGHIEQKNLALSLATYDYVLSLDADEALSHRLKESIVEIKKYCNYDAYCFHRLTNYCGKWIKHCGWYPDTKIRLWNKNKGKWGGENPHDKVILQNNTSLKKLKGNLLHYSYHSFREHIEQIQSFTDISAREAYKKGKKATIAMIVVKPILKFFQSFFFKLGFLDGFYGFVVCINASYTKFLKYLKLYEHDKQDAN